MSNWRKSTYSFSNGNCVEVAEDPVPWRTSSRSEAGTCVQVAPGVLVRDSNNPGGPVLEFSGSTWGRFTAAVKGRAGRPAR